MLYKPRGRSFLPGNNVNPSGRPKSNNPKKGRCTLYATDEEWRELTERSAAKGMSIHSFIRSELFDTGNNI